MADKKMMQITSMTLSLDVKDLNYGAGQSRFINMKVALPEGDEGIPMEDIDSVVDQSLDMHLALWESLTIAKYAAGELKGQDAIALVDKAKDRTRKMREYLKTSSINPEEDQSCKS